MDEDIHIWELVHRRWRKRYASVAGRTWKRQAQGETARTSAEPLVFTEMEAQIERVIDVCVMVCLVVFLLLPVVLPICILMF